VILSLSLVDVDVDDGCLGPRRREVVYVHVYIHVYEGEQRAERRADSAVLAVGPRMRRLLP
jgi:hypothetical protein